MEKYLTELIDRMLDDSDNNIVPFISSNTISWKAFREAERITDETYIPQLIIFIDNEKNKEKRGHAYFILGHIAKNVGDITATKYLISRVDKEKDKSIISSLLRRIENLQKPSDTNIQPLLDATYSTISQIRTSAILSLKNTKNNLAEETLLNIIKNPADEYDLMYVNWSIANIGTRKSISFLLQLLDHKKQDVSGSALEAILAIGDASDLPIFIGQLEKGKNKFTALLGVIKYGDAIIIPKIVARIKQLVSKKRAIEVIGTDRKTEIVFALEFLADFTTESNEPTKVYELLTTKKQELLWHNEKQWLIENKSKFES